MAKSDVPGEKFADTIVNKRMPSSINLIELGALKFYKIEPWLMKRARAIGKNNS
jgi:hypothetical protein